MQLVYAIIIAHSHALSLEEKFSCIGTKASKEIIDEETLSTYECNG